MHGLAAGLFAIMCSNIHVLEDGCVQNKSVYAICSHDETSFPLDRRKICLASRLDISFIFCFLIGRLVANGLVFVADIDFKDTDTTLFPLLFEMVQLRSACEEGLFAFFASLDCYTLVPGSFEPSEPFDELTLLFLKPGICRGVNGG